MTPPGNIIIDDSLGPIIFAPDDSVDATVINPCRKSAGRSGRNWRTRESGGFGRRAPPEPVRIAARYIVAHSKYLAKIAQEGANPAQTYFLHTDMLGSIKAVTDSTGQVVARFDYEPFGLLIEESSPASTGGGRYTGKPLDAELGLYYFGARYYDPGLGRFITADPAKDGLNWYAYCMANPMVLADPNGQQPILITQGWQGTAVHLAIEWHLELGLGLVMPDVARVEPEITFKQLDLPDARLDVRVTWKDALKEHYSIKQGTTWGENGRN
jgi:RHS repeat-associated protein